MHQFNASVYAVYTCQHEEVPDGAIRFIIRFIMVHISGMDWVAIFTGQRHKPLSLPQCFHNQIMALSFAEAVFFLFLFSQ